MVKVISVFKGTEETELGVFDSQKDALLAIANDIEWEEGDDPHDYVFRIEECDEDYEEPYDIDDDCGFDPYCGCYTYDCQGQQLQKKKKGNRVMKATGIVRRVDDLGRIVIPKEIRKQLKIGESDPLEIFLSSDGEIVLKPYRTDYILRKADGWEELEDPRGNVVAQGHRLSAEEVLSALGVEFHTQEFEED